MRKFLVIAALSGGLFSNGSLVAARSQGEPESRAACPAGYALLERICVRQSGSDSSSAVTRASSPAGGVVRCRPRYQDLYFLCFDPETGHIENVDAW